MKMLVLLPLFFCSVSLFAAQPKPETKQASFADMVITQDGVLNIFDEYVYRPVMGTFTEKNVMRMEVDKLCKLLTEKITQAMTEFIKIGKEAKDMQRKGATEAELREQHSRMADIYFDLRPAEPIVRMMYPKMNKLFDQLIELREQLDYSITDTNVIIKDPSEKTIMEKILGK